MALLLTWISFNTSIHYKRGNELFINSLSLQRWSHRSLGEEEYFYPTFYRACDDLSMSRPKLMHIKKGPSLLFVIETIPFLRYPWYRLSDPRFSNDWCEILFLKFKPNHFSMCYAYGILFLNPLFLRDVYVHLSSMREQNQNCWSEF